MTPAERLRHAMDRDKGDNLERARAAFRAHTPEMLDREYGQSGKSCRQILAEYEDDRRAWQVASDMLDSMIAAVPSHDQK